MASFTTNDQSSYHPQLCTLYNRDALIVGPFQKYPAFRGRLQLRRRILRRGQYQSQRWSRTPWLSRSSTSRKPGKINRAIEVAMGRVHHAQSIEAHMFCSSNHVPHRENELEIDHTGVTLFAEQTREQSRVILAVPPPKNFIFPAIQSGC